MLEQPLANLTLPKRRQSAILRPLCKRLVDRIQQVRRLGSDGNAVLVGGSKELNADDADIAEGRGSKIS